MLSLPHTVCEGPLLLVSMGVMLLSKGTWYGTTAQAGGRPLIFQRAPAREPWLAALGEVGALLVWREEQHVQSKERGALRCD